MIAMALADLFVANGHVLGPKVPPCAMTPAAAAERRSGAVRRRFAVGRATISRTCGWAAAWRPPISTTTATSTSLVSHLDRPVALLRNDTDTSRHFVGFDLRTRNRIPPVGGRVVVTAGSYRRTLPVQAGGSYLSASDGRLLFGLADRDRAGHGRDFLALRAESTSASTWTWTGIGSSMRARHRSRWPDCLAGYPRMRPSGQFKLGPSLRS